VKFTPYSKPGTIVAVSVLVCPVVRVNESDESDTAHVPGVRVGVGVGPPVGVGVGVGLPVGVGVGHELFEQARS